jgi:hypothetical protein
MAPELWNLKDAGHYLNVSAVRATPVAADDPTFPTPVDEGARRWSRAKVSGGPSGAGGARRPWRKRI